MIFNFEKDLSADATVTGMVRNNNSNLHNCGKEEAILAL
jgi:hypothetical protein